MPIYEYKCTICDERFEVEQSIKDKALTTIAGADETHPKNKHPVKKVFHAPGIAFKGTGFYKNDSRKGGKSSSSSTSESSSSESSSSPSSSSSDTGTVSSTKADTTKTPSKTPAD